MTCAGPEEFFFFFLLGSIISLCIVQSDYLYSTLYQIDWNLKNVSTSQCCASPTTSPDSLSSRLLHFTEITSSKAPTLMLLSKMSWCYLRHLFFEPPIGVKGTSKAGATEVTAVIRLCDAGHVFAVRCLAALTVSLLNIAPRHPYETTASTFVGTCIHLRRCTVPSAWRKRPVLGNYGSNRGRWCVVHDQTHWWDGEWEKQLILKLGELHNDSK